MLLAGASKDVREEDGLRIDKDGRGEGEASADMFGWGDVKFEVCEGRNLDLQSALPEALVLS